MGNKPKKYLDLENNIDDMENLDEEILSDGVNDDDIIEDAEINNVEKDDFDLIHRFNTNKHKQEGKHKLKRDTIFKGKLEKKDELEEIVGYGFERDEYSDAMRMFNNEMNTDEDHINQNELSKDVYRVLDEMTELDFTQNRKKPNKETFNGYYNLLLKELGYRYTKSELFVELAFYFTDNIFNVFKLLDKIPATVIIKDLTQKGYLRNLDGINFL